MPERYFTDFIRPELLALVPVLYIIGTWLKKSAFRDENIPIFLGGVSVGLASLYVLASFSPDGMREWMTAVFIAITQGVLCAGAAVFANQLFKQNGKLKECICEAEMQEKTDVQDAATAGKANGAKRKKKNKRL